MNFLNEIEHQDMETGLIQIRWLLQARLLSKMRYVSEK